MTDFSVAALARKWADGCPHIAPEWEPAPHQPIEMCCLKAAIHEALEEAEWAVCSRCAKGLALLDVTTCQSMGHFRGHKRCHPLSWHADGTVKGHINCPAAAIRALRGN